MPWFGGAKPSINALVEAHYAALYRYAYRLSGSAPEAEDLTQETFCQAQTKLFQLREEAKAKSWLFTILRNAYLHRLRSSKQEKQVSLPGLAEIPERTPDAEPIVDSAQLQKALNDLPELFRTPIILYYFEDFSYKDIAEQMNVPLGTVMSRLAQGEEFSARAADGSRGTGRAEPRDRPIGGIVMECHDVHELLAFVNRQAEALDATECDAIRAHIEQCPDCAALVQADLRADQTLGALMRDVPVPTGLKQQVLNRLAAERGVTRWRTVKRGALVAAAATLLIALAGAGFWFTRLPADITRADVDAILLAVNKNGNWNEDTAKAYLKSQGFSDDVPTQFAWKYLQSVETVAFKGRRVAKLTFANGADIAWVFVLPAQRFRTNELADDPTCIQVVADKDHEIIYLILFRGNLGALQPVQISA